MAEIQDLSEAKKIRYEYDILDRLVREHLIDMDANTQIGELAIQYDDDKNRISGYDTDIEGITRSIDYRYSTSELTSDLIAGVKQDGSEVISYNYDGLNRLEKRTLPTTTPYVSEYTYQEGATTNSTTALVKSVKNGADMLFYVYDNMGNIQSISENGSVVESYTYDALGQLKTVTRGADVYEYTYDNGGNILSEKKNGVVTKTYTYGDSSWKELMTAYNGDTITYDAIGNPLTYREGMAFTWTDGRKLSTVTKGTDNISYTYGEDGLRISKTVNGVTTEYIYLNGALQAQKAGGTYISFLYDESGLPYGLITKNGSTETTYYYEFNAQGDIIGIIDSAGMQVVEYTYGAWGELLSVTGTLAETIGQQNPLRYRGYYYDVETGFYYLQSRYYDAEVGRFINADGYVSTGQGVLGNSLFLY